MINENNNFSRFGQSENRLEAINRLAAGVAHEIRNSLTEVFGFVQLLESSVDLTPSQREYFENIYNGVESINGIINELLMLQESLDLRTRPTSALMLIDEMMGKVKNQACDQGTSLVYKQFGPLPMVEVDQSAIGYALFNLMENALEAIGQGGEVTITTRFQSGRKMVVIEITDTGGGIDASSLRLIFEPFFSGKPLGTGLGLCSAQNIIKQHGGALKVISCVGQGSTFLVELPAIIFETI